MKKFLFARVIIGAWIVLTLMTILVAQLYLEPISNSYTNHTYIFAAVALISLTIRASAWSGISWDYYNAAWRGGIALAATAWALTAPSLASTSDIQTSGREAPVSRI